MLNLSKESPYGVIVCGAGHAGCEAALASARMGVKTLLLTGRPVEKKCPRCGGYMVEKGNKLACADEHCGYTEAKEKETE